MKNLCGCIYSSKGDTIIFVTFEDENNNRYIKVFINIYQKYDMVFNEHKLPHSLSIIYHYTKAKSCIEQWNGIRYLKGVNISQKYDVLLTIDSIYKGITDMVQENIFDGISCNNIIHYIDMFIFDLYTTMMQVKLNYDTKCLITRNAKQTKKEYDFYDFIKSKNMQYNNK